MIFSYQYMLLNFSFPRHLKKIIFFLFLGDQRFEKNWAVSCERELDPSQMIKMFINICESFIPKSKIFGLSQSQHITTFHKKNVYIIYGMLC